MRLLAAGLHAHGQWSNSDNTDRHFQEIGADVYGVLSATWSTVVITTSKDVVSSGYQKWTQPRGDHEFHSAIGNHNGLSAALDKEGQLWVASSPGLVLLHDDRSGPSLSKLAMAGNGRVVICHAQAANGSLAHIGEFASFEAFRKWYRDASDPKNYPHAHHMIPGRPKQLVAGSGTFALLMQDGTMYTWGDPRYQTLARTIADGVPANIPGVVDALGGLLVNKIAIGGWLGAAIANGAAYIWGSSMPGKDQGIACLNMIGDGGQLVLVEVPDDNGEDEPDTVDIAVGEGHTVLVRADGSVFVVGENQHGQLGLNADTATFLPDWTGLAGIRARAVICGAKTTFLLSEP